MQSLRILIVEDEPIIAADLQDRLQDLGYEVLGPFPSGEEAMNFVLSGQSTIDLVLMDVVLEGPLNGIETVRRLKQTQPAIPVIFLTSNTDDATFAEARSVQPHAFLTKPFRGRDLKYAIELAISHTAGAPEPQPVEKENEALLLNDRLFIKVKDRMVRLFLDDILYISADDYYCNIITPDKNYLITQTLKKLQDELSGQQNIVRVHRSYMVNLRHITEISESYLYIDQHQIPYNKSAREELLKWIKKI